MSVDIITPTHSQAARLAVMLDAFAKSNVPHRHIIWDNSPEGYAAHFASPDVLVLPDEPLNARENVPFARANNLCAAHAEYDWLLFCNDDVEPQPDLVATMLDVAAVPGVSLVGARLLYPDGLVQHGGVGLDHQLNPWHLWRFAAPGDPGPLATRPVIAVTGACMMVDRELFAALGGFDEALAWSYEDVDFCFRVREAGHVIAYCAEAVAVHHEGATRGRTHANDAVNWDYMRRKWLLTGRIFSMLGVWPA